MFFAYPFFVVVVVVVVWLKNVSFTYSTSHILLASSTTLFPSFVFVATTTFAHSFSRHVHAKQSNPFTTRVRFFSFIAASTAFSTIPMPLLFSFSISFVAPSTVPTTHDSAANAAATTSSLSFTSFTSSTPLVVKVVVARSSASRIAPTTATNLSSSWSRSASAANATRLCVCFFGCACDVISSRICSTGFILCSTIGWFFFFFASSSSSSSSSSFVCVLCDVFYPSKKEEEKKRFSLRESFSLFLLSPSRTSDSSLPSSLIVHRGSLSLSLCAKIARLSNTALAFYMV